MGDGIRQGNLQLTGLDDVPQCVLVDTEPVVARARTVDDVNLRDGAARAGGGAAAGGKQRKRERGVAWLLARQEAYAHDRHRRRAAAFGRWRLRRLRRLLLLGLFGLLSLLRNTQAGGLLGCGVIGCGRRGLRWLGLGCSSRRHGNCLICLGRSSRGRLCRGRWRGGRDVSGEVADGLVVVLHGELDVVEAGARGCEQLDAGVDRLAVRDGGRHRPHELDRHQVAVGKSLDRRCNLDQGRGHACDLGVGLELLAGVDLEGVGRLCRCFRCC
mmetsp:Transcript_84463/g.242520  ORF Transcript_84463/g.242520 Transcript_84463/m.242520 type:complete len:271 (+) Transcript_84463:588-1400(+)